LRIYELTFIVDPRVSDEDVVSLTDEVKKLLEAGGAEIPRTESWGRRKMAYPISKLKEGKYVLLYVTTEGGNPLPEVEVRLQQNDKILRFLTVRTDRAEDIVSPVGEEEEAAATAEGEAPS